MIGNVVLKLRFILKAIISGRASHYLVARHQSSRTRVTFSRAQMAMAPALDKPVPTGGAHRNPVLQIKILCDRHHQTALFPKSRLLRVELQLY